MIKYIGWLAFAVSVLVGVMLYRHDAAIEQSIQRESLKREAAYAYAVKSLLGVTRECGTRPVEQWRPLVGAMLKYNTTLHPLQLPEDLKDKELQLVMALVATESEGDPCAQSPAGARGLMQLMPVTWQECGVNNPNDPVQNLDCGIGYLRRLLVWSNGDVTQALRAYNLGVGNLAKAGRAGTALPQETQEYPQKILRRMQDFK